MPHTASLHPVAGAGLSAPPRPSAFGRAWRLSRADYRRLGESGILGPALRTELIDGEVVEMPPIGHPHAGTVDLIADRLRTAAAGRAILRVQNPIFLDDYTEPLPDLALLRPRPDFYRSGHPGPTDVLLVIEVADSSLAYDRDVKLPRYARAGIPEVWLVDLGGGRLLRHREPAATGYGAVLAGADLAAVPLPVGDGLTIDLTGLF